MFKIWRINEYVHYASSGRKFLIHWSYCRPEIEQICAVNEGDIFFFTIRAWIPYSKPWQLFMRCCVVYIKIDSSDTFFIIIRCKSFFLFIGREPTTWPANNCLQIMVCSCAMSFNCFWLQILFCSCVNETTLFWFLRSLLRENDRSLRFPKILLKQTKKNEQKKSHYYYLYN